MSETEGQGDDSGIDPPPAGLVVVDKPAGVTSHDVVNRCRRIFATRKVGHAGTLDPMATGVLVVGIERATKILGLLTTSTKSYRGTIRLGQATSTDDAEGEVLQTTSAAELTDEQIEAAVAGMRGDIEQVPSSVSAVKIGGKRAYRLAREGVPVKMAPRQVHIDRFEVTEIRRHCGVIDVDVDVDCSSGTYIRALARDLGLQLEVGGHLTALRRNRVGQFTLDHAYTLGELASSPRLSCSLDQACLAVFPRRDVSSEEAESTRHGRPLAAAGIDGVYATVDPTGRVTALLCDRDDRTKSIVVLRPAAC